MSAGGGARPLKAERRPPGATDTAAPPGLVGAVLAGGASSRLGRDKAAEMLDGLRMIERAVTMLRAVCEEVFIVSSRPDTPSGHFEVVPDLRPDSGPLAGIESALVRARHLDARAVLVIACDLPLLDEETVAAVVRGLGEGRAAAAARPGDPDFEPLLAVYTVDCLDDARGLLDRGERSARALFEAVGGTRVPIDEGKMLNVNTEQELRRARALVPAGRRLESLDAFRGLTIAGMILVNNPGSWSYVYPPLGHAAWHGWTPTDLIFPYFLFIVGVAIPFSFARRIAEDANRSKLMRHVVRRSLVLIGLGIAMRAIPDFDFGSMRLYGVLQRIGLVYLVAAGAYLYLDARRRWTMTLVALLGYWALMSWVPVPGYGAGDLSPDGNLAAWLDRLLMPGRLWQGTWDPEGLLSTLPAVATTLLGIVTGEWLRSGRTSGSLVRGMLAVGAVLVALGMAWDIVFPINKNLWTSSYVVFTAGTALLLLGALYWLIDVRHAGGAWSRWMVVYGRNAIAVFVASGMLTKTMTRIRIGGEEGTSLYTWIYEHVFRSWAGDYPGSVAFAASYVVFWLGLMWLLDRRGIYLKV